MKYPIKYMVNPPSKTFEINELEEKFFNTLYSKLSKKVNENIHLIRMATGTLAVECNGYCIGKVKLQGNKHDMQILTSLYDSHVVYDNFIEHIDEWVKYINKYIIKEL
jgi:hypothetical protein